MKVSSIRTVIRIYWQALYPNLRSYDPAFGFEVAALVREGMHQMYELQQDVFYYLTLYNENYPMQSLTQIAEQSQTDEATVLQGVIAGGYCCYRGLEAAECSVHILASGSIHATGIVSERHLGRFRNRCMHLEHDEFLSSCKRDALACQQYNRENPQAQAKVSRLEQMFQSESGVFIAVTDYMAALAQGIAAWMPAGFEVLGTDGYGLSESRSRLREHFSVDAVAVAEAIR